MSEKTDKPTRFDFNAYRPDEAATLAAGQAYKHGLNAVKLRVDYMTMQYILWNVRPRSEDFIVEEKHVYLALCTPTGRLLVYFDKAITTQGTGYLVCESPDCEIEVAFAY